MKGIILIDTCEEQVENCLLAEDLKEMSLRRYCSPMTTKPICTCWKFS